MHIRVFHTTNLRDARFEPTKEAIEVFQYVSDCKATAQEYCEQAFTLFNVGHEPKIVGTPDTIAVAYRLRRNRSLSIGDLVAIGDGNGTYEVYELRGDTGWTRREEPELTETSIYGSTWFYAPIPTDDEVELMALRLG